MTWVTAFRLGKRYLIFTVFEGLLMQVYLGNFSGTFINVKTKLRKPSNSRSGSLKIPCTISAISIEVLTKINPWLRWPWCFRQCYALMVTSFIQTVTELRFTNAWLYCFQLLIWYLAFFSFPITTSGLTSWWSDRRNCD